MTPRWRPENDGQPLGQPLGLPPDKCPDCGDPIDGPALMNRCEKNHTKPKGTHR